MSSGEGGEAASRWRCGGAVLVGRAAGGSKDDGAKHGDDPTLRVNTGWRHRDGGATGGGERGPGNDARPVACCSGARAVVLVLPASQACLRHSTCARLCVRACYACCAQATSIHMVTLCTS